MLAFVHAHNIAHFFFKMYRSLVLAIYNGITTTAQCVATDHTNNKSYLFTYFEKQSNMKKVLAENSMQILHCWDGFV